jgi:hypothetical protein
MSTPSQGYEHEVTLVAGSEQMYALQIGAAFTAGQTFAAGSLVSLTTAGTLSAGCADNAMPLWAINGVADLDVARDDGIMGGGKVNAFVGTGGFELFTTEAASGQTYNPNVLLTASTGNGEVGKVTALGSTGYNDRVIVGCVSRGASSDQYGVSTLYFWPMFIPKSSHS